MALFCSLNTAIQHIFTNTYFMSFIEIDRRNEIETGINMNNYRDILNCESFDDLLDIFILVTS